MTGTLVNTGGAVLAGSLIGMTVGKYLPERLKTIAMQGLGISHLGVAQIRIENFLPALLLRDHFGRFQNRD